MDFIIDSFHSIIRYIPLLSGAYIIILIFRFADLTIEASWSIGGIVTCIAIKLGINLLISPLLGLFFGALCGVLTLFIFKVIGGGKLLSGIISYYLLTAIGFHLLGSEATITLERVNTKFGFIADNINSTIVYSIYSGLIFVFVFVWQRSKLGIKSRLIGEKPVSVKYYNYSRDLYYGLALIIGNALIGLGGGLWASYFGYASNVQGIGMVINAFLGLLIGQSVVQLIGYKRNVPLIILIGSMFFVLIKKIGEFILTNIHLNYDIEFIKSSDNSLFIGLILLFILYIKRGYIKEKSIVSEW